MSAAAEQLTGIRITPRAAAARVQRAYPWDRARLAGTITRAFADDPPSRWLYPDDARYRRAFPKFVRAFAGDSVELGTTYQVGDIAACAMWLPPGAGSDGAGLVEHVERHVEPHRHDEVFAVFDALGRAHPAGAHWYLPLIGVEPTLQGHGFGSALLRHVLRACDRSGTPAYLEATSPRNVALYERHGFRRLAPVQVGSCPPITPMWRAA